MKNEKIFWGVLLLVSVCFIMIPSYFFMVVIFPFHVEQMKKRAIETVDHMQTVMLHLPAEARQAYLERILKKTDGLSYLLLMDVAGIALAHSSPERVGLRFDEPGIRQAIKTGTRIEQVYIRDADNPASPYHNEKTIDIIEPFYGVDGTLAGAVNVGISLAAIEGIKQRYIFFSAVAATCWLLFVSIFAVSHLRTMALKRQTARALRESERRLSHAIAATSDVIWEYDLISGRLYYSSRWYGILGYSDQEFESTLDQWKASCHPEDVQRVLDKIQAVIAIHDKNGYEIEFRMRDKQGAWRWFLGRGNAVEFDPEGAPLLLSGTIADITERKRNEERLRESESRYRRVIENIQDVYYRTDREGNLLFISPSGIRLLGYEEPTEVLGQPNASFWVHPEERAAMLEIIRKNGKVLDYEVLLRRQDGSAVQVSTSSGYYRDQNGEVQGVEGIIRDISERKRAEKEWKKLQEQLLQSQKMEAVGRLAGGVAHDFNNMLAVIMGRAELALMKISTDNPTYANLQEIRDVADRSASLTRRLLAFARKQTVEPKIFDLNEAVDGLLKMHQRLIGEDIEIEWIPAQDRLLVRMDPSQLDQILTNLCVNARDAISGVGKITIVTGLVSLDPALGTPHAELAPGEYVVLTVSDTGCGMEKDLMMHIFEPFFTTKDIGKGTGLGLATVFGIVQQNGGMVEAGSTPGEGSMFTLYLPKYGGEAQPIEMIGTLALLKGQGETILLVEDEAAILAMGTLMLEELQYQVLAASTPHEALRIAGTCSREIHLLMTDVVMPQMNGRALATRILELRPEITCLFMSGYTADIISLRGVQDGDVHFIQKPFTIHSLAEKVHEVLREKTESAVSR